ncbi:MAG: RNA polymerase sigma factor RpoH, partial [Gammaproteobacteria bacterium]|nr:RNA polymerase sigma factor RpoH [Gammaproteobacteria bacterium]
MSNALTVNSNQMTLPVITGDVSSYISKISNTPVLSAEEEKRLATRLIKYDDLDAAKQLIMSQLRFVVHIARGYSGYGLPLADLIQEGNLGLMKAVKRFDPDKGVRLISFAVHWIRAEIHEYVIRNWRIVKVATTKAQRKLFFKLRSTKKRLSWFNPEEVEQVANDLGVKPEVVLEMESRMSGHDASFDLPVNSADEDKTSSPSDYIFEEGQTPEQLLIGDDQRSNDIDMLNEGMSELDERSREILSRRWLDDGKATLQELATEFSVSPE